jgi:antitoxin component YwqK of YwqJK toxin-antitoxin module
MLLVAAIAACACACTGEETPPDITYPENRRSIRNIDVGGMLVGVGDGIEWQSIKVYLSFSELVAVDTKTDKAIWHRRISPFWRRMAIKEIEATPGAKTWAVELGARKGDDPGQQLTECYDLKTGAKIDRPQVKPAGVSLLPVRTWGGECSVARRFHALISTRENFENVWSRLHGTPDAVIREDLLEPEPALPSRGLLEPPKHPLPEVDFSKEVVLVYCCGDGANSSGLVAMECYEDDQRILLRTKLQGFQTMNHWIFTRDSALFFLPRRANKAYVLEHDHQRYIGGPPIWKEVFRTTAIGDGSHELEPMPAPPKPAALPAGFRREMLTFKSASPEKDPLARFEDGEEYEYFRGPDGEPIRHGPYVKFSRGSVDKIKYRGLYDSGLQHGQWTFYDRKWGDWDNKTPYFTLTYDHGRLNGPIQVFNDDGTVSCTGTYEDGKAHGVWVWYHANGQKFEEFTYNHGLLDGVATEWDEAGHKIGEAHYANGQFQGPYTRWYADSMVAVKGQFIARDAAPVTKDATGSVFDQTRVVKGDALLRGYRHGEWVRYDKAGKELWRGAFDRGTGKLTGFSDEGVKVLEADLVDGVIDGTYRVWNENGTLAKVETIKPGAECVRISYHGNGAKESETRWLRGREDGVQRWWDRGGKLEAEGEWRGGKPWSGDCMDSWGGAIYACREGKRVEGTAFRRTLKVQEEIRERERREKQGR